MTISLCMPYYSNPMMLAHQYGVWAAYHDQLKEQIEIVLVDDGSPDPAVDVERPDGLPALRIYRVLEDRPWHQHAARNLAATEAVNEWLWMTDMDHVIPADSMQAMLKRLETANAADVFSFHRVDAPDLSPTLNDRGERKPHVNTFVLRKAHYWQIGGYDEACVGYGTDSYFRKRLFEHKPAVFLPDIPIVRYPREVIADASTRPPTPMDPRAFRNASRRRQETADRLAKKRAKGITAPTVLDFPWMRAL